MRVVMFSIMFVVLSTLSSALMINEIMYNPSGSDSGREWVEIFNNESVEIELESWFFVENGIDHNLEVVQGNKTLQAGEFAIIADEAEKFLIDYSNFEGILIDSSWSSLNNKGEEIALKDSNGIVVDIVNYTTEFGNGNNRSLERFFYGWNESNNNGGSPGKQNNATIPIKEEIQKNTGISIDLNLESPLFVGVSYTSLFEIKNLDHISGVTSNIDVTIQYTISKENVTITNETILVEGLNARKTANTGFFLPNAAGTYRITGEIVDSTSLDNNLNDNFVAAVVDVLNTQSIPCNISINVSSNQFIFNESDSLSIHNTLNNGSYPYTIEYWVEDFFGTIYKKKVNTSNTNKKSWKTNIDEQDRVLFLKNKVYPLCNDTNHADNEAEVMFIVKSNPTNTEIEDSDDDSTIAILDNTEKAQFGEAIDVELEIYKGDTGKYSISAWVEDDGKKISEITKLRVFDKFSTYHGEIPILLDNNCNGRLKDANYDLIVEGLGERDKENIKIEGSKSCPKASSTSSSKTEESSKQKSKLVFEVQEQDTIFADEEFETTILLKNEFDYTMPVKLWSYVYRGSKSYSGEREENMRTFTLDPQEEREIALKNTVFDAEAGEYKFKVLLNKNNQKTNADITTDITVQENVQTKELITKTQQAPEKPTQTSEEAQTQEIKQQLSEPIVVYESSTEKARKTISYFIIGMLVFLVVALLLII